MAEDPTTEGLFLRNLSLNNLIVAGPTIAAVFAFAYVIGYFYAYDIAWFPFFSFAEHLVFAIRALPVAVGACVIFIIALGELTRVHGAGTDVLKSPKSGKVELEKAQATNKQPSPEQRGRLWRSQKLYWKLAWIVVLLVAASVLFSFHHYGPAISVTVIFIGTAVFFFVEIHLAPAVNILFVGINVIVGCVLAGFVSGSLERPNQVFGLFDIPAWITSTNSMIIVTNKPRNSNKFLVGRGHVIFVGNAGVLYYDYDKEKVRLLRKEDVSEICECKSKSPKCLNEFKIKSQCDRNTSKCKCTESDCTTLDFDCSTSPSDTSNNREADLGG